MGRRSYLCPISTKAGIFHGCQLVICVMLKRRQTPYLKSLARGGRVSPLHKSALSSSRPWLFSLKLGREVNPHEHCCPLQIISVTMSPNVLNSSSVKWHCNWIYNLFCPVIIKISIISIIYGWQPCCMLSKRHIETERLQAPHHCS